MLYQYYQVLILLFNITCSLIQILSTTILVKLHLMTQPKDATVHFPKTLQDRYQYPRLTDLCWILISFTMYSQLYKLVLHLLPTNFYLSHPYTQYLFIVSGIFFAMIRLDAWRLFVTDFLREVHRIKEMKILETCLNDIAMFNKNTQLKVLDFGGGKGKTTEHMLNHCKSTVASVQAIDIAEHLPHVKEYDGTTIPFPSNSFDVSIAMYVFHHIPETAALMQQLKKTCKYILIYEDLPTETKSPLLSKLTFGVHFLLFNQSVHTHLDHTREEWKALFAEWKMSVVKEYEIVPTTAIPYQRIAFLLDAHPEKQD